MYKLTIEYYENKDIETMTFKKAVTCIDAYNALLTEYTEVYVNCRIEIGPTYFVIHDGSKPIINVCYTKE